MEFSQFQKFTILNTKDVQPLENSEVEILFNVDHIVSIKPINIIAGQDLIEGYWIRTSNGKKYKATQIPSKMALIIDSNDPSIETVEETQVQSAPAIH